MFHHMLSSALSTVFDLAFAILPAAPLFALKRLPPSAVKNIVLVHGAFTDGSSWSKVIPLLQEMGCSTRN
jgi:hypothetical protein